MCVYIYICMCVYIYVCIYIYVCYVYLSIEMYLTSTFDIHKIVSFFFRFVDLWFSLFHH